MGSGAIKFTEASKYRLLSTVKFAGFISLSIEVIKLTKSSSY